MREVPIGGWKETCGIKLLRDRRVRVVDVSEVRVSRSKKASRKEYE